METVEKLFAVMKSGEQVEEDLLSAIRSFIGLLANMASPTPE